MHRVCRALTLVVSSLILSSPPQGVLPENRSGFFFFFFFFPFFFLGSHLQHMEVPSLGTETELQPLAYTTATVTPDPSRICSNAGSLTHWAWPGIKQHPHGQYVGFLTRWATTGIPGAVLFAAVSPKPNTMLGTLAGALKRHVSKSWHFKYQKVQPYGYHQNLVGWDSTLVCKH